MSIKLMMEIERAHARLDELEKPGLFTETISALLLRIEKLEGEIKAMKARMGKHPVEA